MTQPTIINLETYECNQEFHYYPFGLKLEICVGICNTLNDLSNKVCVSNKTEDLSLSVSNIITGINKSNALTKQVSCECKCRFYGKNVIQINVEITINVDLSVKTSCIWKRLFGIVLHVIEKMKKKKKKKKQMLWLIQQLCLMKL